MKTMDKLKCLLFGHPNNMLLNDQKIQWIVTSAKNPFRMVYCPRCDKVDFVELRYENAVQEMKEQLAREEQESYANALFSKMSELRREDGLDMFDYYVLKGIVEARECHISRLDQLRRIVEKMERTWPALQTLPKKPKRKERHGK